MAVRTYCPDTDFWYACTVTSALEIRPWVKIMTHPWVMNNNCVNNHPDQTWKWGVMVRIRIFCVCAEWVCDLDLGCKTLGQGHDTPLGHGQQLCEILSISEMAVRSYGPDTDIGYACTLTLTFKVLPCVKVMTHPLSRTTIVWNII